MTIPEELRDITFDKSAFGYRVDDVDDYVDKINAVVTALMEENSELEEKLEVLAARVAEYKADEDSLHSAIVGAQKLGDSIVRDSKLKAESILREANVRAERLVEAAHRKVEVEQQNYVLIHQQVHDFRNSLMGMYKSHIDLITNLPTVETEQEPARPAEAPAPAPAPVEEAPAEEPAFQPEPAAEPLAEEATQPAPVEGFDDPLPNQLAFEQPEEDFAQPEPEEAFVEEPEPEHHGRHSSRFGDLLFGQNIDID